MACEDDLKTGRFQDFDAGLKVRFIKGACRRDDTDSVTRSEPCRFYYGYAFDKLYPFVKGVKRQPGVRKAELGVIID
ncbi:MAG: hypothetical protein DRJ45_09590 [Thermoprotei archaeon]|nr:MAG: hypothetical protein DRJ45_09590 [Thermoprotei archaeon]